MKNYNKSRCVADIDERDADSEATIPDIQWAPIQTEKPYPFTKASLFRTHETNVEPPANNFIKDLEEK